MRTGKDSLTTAEPAQGRRLSATRYWNIYLAMWKNSITREAMFKMNFLLWIVVEMLWFAMQIAFIHVIYMHTDSIASWSKWEVVLLMGASQFIQQIFGALFLTNITGLSELIRTGRLDFMLLLPANTRFLISFRQVDLGGFVNALSALAVMAYAAGQLALSPSLAQLGGCLILCLFGVTIHYSLMLFLSCVSFWTVRSEGVVWGYYNLFNIARLPDEAFQGLFKAFFTFALPMLLVANVPARLLAEKLESMSLVGALTGMTVLCFLASELMWRFSVKRYTSASS